MAPSVEHNVESWQTGHKLGAQNPSKNYCFWKLQLCSDLDEKHFFAPGPSETHKLGKLDRHWVLVFVFFHMVLRLF